MSSAMYCRLCGAFSEDLVDLFLENDSDVSISLKIRIILCISITKNDRLSHQICSSCNNKIQEIYLFIKKCQQIQIKLFSENTMSDTVSIWKMEIDDPDFQPNVIENIKMEHVDAVDVDKISSEDNLLLVDPDTDVVDETISEAPINDITSKQSCFPGNKSNSSVGNLENNQISYSKLATFFRSKVKFGSENRNNVSSKISALINAPKEVISHNKTDKNSSKVDPLFVSRVNRLVQLTKKQNTTSSSSENNSSVARLSALKNLRIHEKTSSRFSRNIFNSAILHSNINTEEKSKLAEKILVLKSKEKSISSENKEMINARNKSDENQKRIYAKNRNENSVRCPYCGEIFSRDEFRTEHMPLHTDDEELHKIILEHVAPTPVIKQLDCKECNIPFHRELAYIEHMNQHSDHRPVKCHLCDRKFFGHKKTRSHVRAHLVSTFKCELCSYMAKTRQDLQTHHRGVHTGERIMCNICGKLLSAFEHNMKKHLETHNETRPYVCDVCGVSFKTRAGLSKHRENLHFPVSMMCSLCGTISGSKQKYKKHYYKCRKRYKKIEVSNSL